MTAAMPSYSVSVSVPEEYERQPGFRGFCREFLAFRTTYVILLTPLILLPLVLYDPDDKALKCGYAVLLMGVYWTTEALPLAATALLPLILFPYLGVLGAKQVCTNYMKDANILFMAGLTVAVAIEDWNLHKRIALRVLMLVGSKPRWLMFGFMCVTAFLSMWISNTATTAMMVPIAQAVLLELRKHYVPDDSDSSVDESSAILTPPNGDNDSPDIEPTTPDVFGAESHELTLTTSSTNYQRNISSCTSQSDASDVPITKRREVSFRSGVERNSRLAEYDMLCKALMLSICYSANVGGTATLTGSPPNMVFKGIVDSLSDSKSGITFASWIMFALPNTLVCLLITWAWLQLFFMGWRTLCGCCFKDIGDDSANKIIRKEYEKLGNWSFAEIAVLCHFIVLALLWLTRDPEFVTGWSALFEDGYITDAATGMVVVFSLFIFPSERPRFLCCRKKDDVSPPGPVAPLLTWERVQEKLAWNVIILLGGGFALADAAKESNLSQWVGNQLGVLGGIPLWSITLIICLVVAFITEFTSNVSTATIFLPIVAQVAVEMGENPLLFMLPITVATSFAFMLPVATPPNAIVFSAGYLRVIDMAKAGFLMNIVCVVTLQLAINTWGFALFDLGTYPPWAASLGGINTTIATATTDVPFTISNVTGSL